MQTQTGQGAPETELLSWLHGLQDKSFDALCLALRERGEKAVQVTVRTEPFLVRRIVYSARLRQKQGLRVGQSVALGLLSAVMLFDFAQNPAYTRGLVLGLLCLLVLAAVWLLPFVDAGNAAKRFCEQNPQPQFCIFEEGVLLDQVAEDAQILPYGRLKGFFTAQALCLLTEENKLFYLPRAELTAEVEMFLREVLGI